MVIHAQAAGIFKNVRVIGDTSKPGDTLAEIGRRTERNLVPDTDHRHSARPLRMVIG